MDSRYVAKKIGNNTSMAYTMLVLNDLRQQCERPPRSCQLVKNILTYKLALTNQLISSNLRKLTYDDDGTEMVSNINREEFYKKTLEVKLMRLEEYEKMKGECELMQRKQQILRQIQPMQYDPAANADHMQEESSGNAAKRPCPINNNRMAKY